LARKEGQPSIQVIDIYEFIFEYAGRLLIGMVFAKLVTKGPDARRIRRNEMKCKGLTILILAALAAGTATCYRPYGYRVYPDTPRFASTNPRGVELLRGEPRRAHIRLGEVWIRPKPMMGRAYVEGILRENAAALGADALVIVADRYFMDRVYSSYWRGPRPVYERQIVGIAIRYRR
jgi:hypothetical protein